MCLNHMVEASHSVNNPVSCRVLRKAGLLLDGRDEGYYRYRNGFQDSGLYGLTKSRSLQQNEEESTNDTKRRKECPTHA